MSNSLKDALKKLCYKITGKKSNKESVQEVVNDITKNYNGASTAYVDQKINEKLATVYTYRGSVSTYASLPMLGEKVGDVYNVLDTGNNYAWNGTEWDDLAGYCLANPSGEATADLSKLKVGSIIYGLADKSYVEGLKRVLKNNSDSEDLMEFTEDNTIVIKDELHAEGGIYFSDGSDMDTAPHLYQHNVMLSFTNVYNDEIGYLKDSGNAILLSSGDWCKIFLSYIDNSNEPVSEYDAFTQYDSLTCNITIRFGSSMYHGVCKLISNESIGDKSYYMLKGLIISTTSPYDFGYVDIDFDSIANDFTITDTITQIL